MDGRTDGWKKKAKEKTKKSNDSIVCAQHGDEIAVCAPIGLIRGGFGGYMPEIILFATIQ